MFDRAKIRRFLKDWVLPKEVQDLIIKTSEALRNQLSPAAMEKKHILQNNEKLLNRHKRERCFILGSGSSVLSQDLSKLIGENVIAVSSSYMHKDYSSIKPKYHVLPNILDGHGSVFTKDEFVNWLREMDQKTLAAEMFFHIGDKALIEENELFKGRTIHWNEYVRWNGRSDFEINLAKVPAIWSVSEFAITVALYLGFEKIYLVGFDHDWFNGSMVYFYDKNSGDLLKPSAEKAAFADAEFQMRRHADMFRKYRYLYDIRNNIYNANANQNSYVDVFPKVEFDSLFANGKDSV